MAKEKRRQKTENPNHNAALDLPRKVPDVSPDKKSVVQEQRGQKRKNLYRRIRAVKYRTFPTDYVLQFFFGLTPRR